MTPSVSGSSFQIIGPDYTKRSSADGFRRWCDCSLKFVIKLPKTGGGGGLRVRGCSRCNRYSGAKSWSAL